MKSAGSITYDAYVEQKLHEIRVCFVCGKLIYKKKRAYRIGNKWLCEDCLKDLRMALRECEEITR